MIWAYLHLIAIVLALLTILKMLRTFRIKFNVNGRMHLRAISMSMRIENGNVHRKKCVQYTINQSFDNSVVLTFPFLTFFLNYYISNIVKVLKRHTNSLKIAKK